ncbi:reverse transcriptase family protein [Pseudoalteromonas sp. SMN1298-MNA-CIBAN-0114]|uniref:reverse transcriptase family protein n=1 Tax=Pseudoalteromonas sp. SMN1298-MNA-CIBAN-0114 TaxID=3140428 RepID=UPI00331F2F1A
MDRLIPEKSTFQSISNIKNLCAALDISEKDLSSALSLRDNEKYVIDHVEKSDGTLRKIHKPHYEIRKIQRRINKRIFKKIVLWPDYIYGCIPNEISSDGKLIKARDYVSCASQHCSTKSLLKIDIKDFFDNISAHLVFEMFSRFFKYNDEISQTLTKLCCFKGTLIQGELTSSYIAALCLWDLEHKVVSRLKRKQLTYTRLVDDITISSKTSNFQFDYALTLVSNMLLEKELPINLHKTKSSSSSILPLVVHGMRVNFEEPRYPSNEVKKLRAAVHNIEKLASEPGYRITHAYRRDFNRCMGRVNKLKRVGHNSHSKLVEKLLRVLPLPAKVDLKRSHTIVARLEKDFKEKHTSYWYHKRFYKAHDRLNILQRTYSKTAQELRLKLKAIKPKYEN